MKINKIYHYKDGSKAVFERINGENRKVAFTKTEYDALIAEEAPLFEGVTTSEFCDYLEAANKRGNKGDTFQAVLDRYRANSYDVVPYEFDHLEMHIKGDVIYENGKPVVITAATRDKIPHSLHAFRKSFGTSLAFLKEKKVIND